jgi:cytochrome bd-type quinol oxidase subunit 2
MTDTNGRWADAAKLAGWTALLTPLTILVHELGHFSIGLTTGLPLELHPTSVSGGAEAGAAADWLVALQAGAGPLMTLAMSLLFAALYSRDRSRLWALAAAVAAASRLLVTTAFLGLRLFLLLLGRPYRATPNFDEHNAARALGLPPLLMAIAATAFLVALYVWLLRRMPQGRRFPFVIALIAGVVVGGAAWTSLPPPVLVSVG